MSKLKATAQINPMDILSGNTNPTHALDNIIATSQANAAQLRQQNAIQERKTQEAIQAVDRNIQRIEQARQNLNQPFTPLLQGNAPQEVKNTLLGGSAGIANPDLQLAPQEYKVTWGDKLGLALNVAEGGYNAVKGVGYLTAGVAAALHPSLKMEDTVGFLRENLGLKAADEWFEKNKSLDEKSLDYHLAQIENNPNMNFFDKALEAAKLSVQNPKASMGMLAESLPEYMLYGLAIGAAAAGSGGTGGAAVATGIAAAKEAAKQGAKRAIASQMGRQMIATGAAEARSEFDELGAESGYTAQNARKALVVGAGAGLLSGATAKLMPKGVTNLENVIAAGMKPTYNLAPTVGKLALGVGAEAIGEGIEEGGVQVISNAVNGRALDEGVGVAMGMGGATGAMLQGGYAGASATAKVPVAVVNGVQTGIEKGAEFVKNSPVLSKGLVITKALFKGTSVDVEQKLTGIANTLTVSSSNYYNMNISEEEREKYRDDFDGLFNTLLDEKNKAKETLQLAQSTKNKKDIAQATKNLKAVDSLLTSYKDFSKALLEDLTPDEIMVNIQKKHQKRLDELRLQNDLNFINTYTGQTATPTESTTTPTQSVATDTVQTVQTTAVQQNQNRKIAVSSSNGLIANMGDYRKGDTGAGTGDHYDLRLVNKTQDINPYLNRFHVMGKPLTEYKQAGKYGEQRAGGKVHYGVDYGINTSFGSNPKARQLYIAPEWLDKVADVTHFDNNKNGGKAGGGWVTRVEFTDGIKVNILHQNKSGAEQVVSTWTKGVGNTNQPATAQKQATGGVTSFETIPDYQKGGDKNSLMLGTYKAMRKAGFTDGQAKYLVAEVNRENDFSVGTLFGHHSDHANSANNFGFISWQQGRKDNIVARLKSAGLPVNKSGVEHSQKALDVMAAYLMEEIKSGKYTLNRYRKGIYASENFLKEANPDRNDHRWGHAIIGWAYGQTKLKNGNSFNDKPHIAKLNNGYKTITDLLGGYSTQPSNTTTTTTTTEPTETNQQVQDEPSRLKQLIAEQESALQKEQDETKRQEMQAQIDGLKAQLDALLNPKDDIDIHAKAQDDAYSEAIKYSVKLSAEHISALFEAGLINQEQANSLRTLSLANQKIAEGNNQLGTHNDIVVGKKGATTEESHRGLVEYQQALQAGIFQRTDGMLERYAQDLYRFEESHSSKAQALQDALTGFIADGKPRYVARLGTENTWSIHDGTLPDVKRKELGAINITSKNQQSFVNQIKLEADMISSMASAYESVINAKKLGQSPQRILANTQLMDLQEYVPTQPTLGGTTRGSVAVQATQQVPVDMSEVPTRNVHNNPTDVPSNPTGFKADTVSFVSKVNTDFNNYHNFVTNTDRNPLNLWIGRESNEHGKGTRSLSNVIAPLATKTDEQGSTIKRSNILNTDGAGNVVSIQAGVFGSPINIAPVNVNNSTQVDDYKIKYEGTQKAQIAAFAEGANRYVDMLKAGVKYNPDLKDAVFNLAFTDGLQMFGTKVNAGKHSEGHILSQVFDAIKTSAKSADDVLGVLQSMGTVMSDGLFHAEVPRNIDLADGYGGWKKNITPDNPEGSALRYEQKIITDDDFDKYDVNSIADVQTQSFTTDDVNTTFADANISDDLITEPTEANNNFDPYDGVEVTGFDLSDFDDNQNTSHNGSNIVPTSDNTQSGTSTPSDTKTAIVQPKNERYAQGIKPNLSKNADTKDTATTGMKAKEVVDNAQETDKPNAKFDEYIDKPVALKDVLDSLDPVASQVQPQVKAEQETPTKIPQENKVYSTHQAQTRGLVDSLMVYNPNFKIQVESKGAKQARLDSGKVFDNDDTDLIRIDADSKDKMADVARAMARNTVGRIADEIDGLTDDDVQNAREFARLWKEEGDKEATEKEKAEVNRINRVVSIKSELDGIRKDVSKQLTKAIRSGSLNEYLADKPQTKRDVIETKIMRAMNSSTGLLFDAINDTDVKAVLENIKVQPKTDKKTGKPSKLISAYKAIVQSVAKYLGISPKQSNAYERLMSSLGRMVELSVDDGAGTFTRSNEAKVAVFNDLNDDEVNRQLTLPLSVPKGSDNETQNQLKAFFNQSSSKDKPLSSIPDFVNQMMVNPIKATQALGLDKPNEVQLNQLKDYALFHQEFSEYLRQTVGTKQNGYKFQSLASYFVDDDGHINENVLGALSRTAYDWIIANGNHLRNTDDDIKQMFGLFDEHQKKEAYVNKAIRERYQFLGDVMSSMTLGLGKQALKDLNIQSNKHASVTVESRLESSIGFWIVSAMQAADLVHIHEVPVATYVEDMRYINPLQAEGFNDSGLGSIKMVSVTNKKGEKRNKLLEQIIEKNRGTAGYLSKMFGGNSFHRQVLTTAPEVGKVKKTVKKTKAVMSQAQAGLIDKVQQSSFEIDDSMNKAMNGLLKHHQDDLMVAIGAKVTQEALDKAHANDRESMLAAADGIKRELTNALDTIASLPTVNGYKKYWDTWYSSGNSRFYPNSNVFNIQSSTLHRAWAGYSEHIVTFKDTGKNKQSIEQALGTMLDKLDTQKIQAKADDFSKLELQLMQFIRALGEHAEGSKEFVENYVKNDPELKEKFQIGFTVDKLPSYVFVPAFLDYMAQPEMLEAVEAMTALLQDKDGKVSDEQAKAIFNAVNSMGMQGRSVRALVEFAKLKQAIDTNSLTFTTGLALGSDGLNNGAALAHNGHGVADNALQDKVGFYGKNSQYENYQQSRENPEVGDYYTAFNTVLDRYLQEKIRIANESIKLAKDDEKHSINKFVAFMNDVVIVHKSLQKRAVAKGVLVPFNYGSGQLATKRAVLRVFLDDVQDLFTDYANGEKVDAVLFNQLISVLYTLNNEKEITLTKVDDSSQTIKLTADTDVSLLKEYWLSKADLNTISNNYLDGGQEFTVWSDDVELPVSLDSVAQIVWDALGEYEGDFIDSNNTLNTAVSLAGDVYIEAYKLKEAEYVYQYKNQLVESYIKNGMNQEQAKTMADKMYDYTGLPTKLQEQLEKELEIIEPKIDSAWSAIFNEPEAKIRVMAQETQSKNDASNLTQNTAFMLNSNGQLQRTHSITAIKKLALQVETLRGTSAQTQSLDSYIAATTAAMDTVTLNIHDNNNGSLENYIEMVRTQNKATYEALIKYSHGMSVFTGMLETAKHLDELGLVLPIHEYNDLQQAHRKLLGHLYVNMDSVASREATKLNQLQNQKSMHQYAGEFGEYLINDEDKKDIPDKLKEVEATSQKVTSELKEILKTQGVHVESEFGDSYNERNFDHAISLDKASVHVAYLPKQKVSKRTGRPYDTGIDFDTWVKMGDDTGLGQNENSILTHLEGKLHYDKSEINKARQWLNTNDKNGKVKGQDGREYHDTKSIHTYMAIQHGDIVYMPMGGYITLSGKVKVHAGARKAKFYATALNKEIYISIDYFDDGNKWYIWSYVTNGWVETVAPKTIAQNSTIYTADTPDFDGHTQKWIESLYKNQADTTEVFEQKQEEQTSKKDHTTKDTYTLDGLSKSIKALKGDVPDTHRRLFTYLSNRAKTINPNLVIKMTDKLSMTDKAGNEHIVEGQYNVNDNTLTLSKDEFAKASDEEKVRIVNHELVHAITEVNIRSGDAKFTNAINDLTKMKNYLLSDWYDNQNKYLNEYGKSVHTYLSKVFDVIDSDKSVSEFSAYGMTDSHFTKHIANYLDLDKASVKPKNETMKVLNAFISAVKRLLNIGNEVAYVTFADTVHKLTLASTESKQQQEQLSLNLEKQSEDSTKFSIKLELQDKALNDSVAEVFSTLDDSGISPEHSNHLDSVMASIYNPMYESIELDADKLADLMDKVDTVTAPSYLFGLNQKESYAYRAVYTALLEQLKSTQNTQASIELKELYGQMLQRFATVSDYEPEFDSLDKADKYKAVQQHKSLFNGKASDEQLAHTMALVFVSEQTKQKLTMKVNKSTKKAESWFDKAMIAISKLVGLFRDKFIYQSDEGTQAMYEIAVKLAKIDADIRKGRISNLDKVWNWVYTKPMNMANKIVDNVLIKPVYNRITKADESINGDKASDEIDDKKAKNIRHTASTAKLLSKVRNGDTEGLNDLIDSIQGNIVDNPNNEFHQVFQEIRGQYDDITRLSERMTSYNTKANQQRANIKQNAIKMLNGLFKEPLDTLQKESITRVLLKTDAQVLLDKHSKEMVATLVTDKSQRNKRIKQLEETLSGLVKDKYQFNDMMMASQETAYYMARETAPKHLLKSAEMVATSTGTDWQSSLDTIDPNIFNAVDELITLHSLNYVDDKYSNVLKQLMTTESDAILKVMRVHQAMVAKGKEEFKDNPYNYNKGFVPSIINPNIDVKSVTADELQDHLDKGYELVMEKPLEQDELDDSEQRFLVRNTEYAAQRRTSGSVDLMDTHHKGYEVAHYKTNVNRLSGIGESRYKQRMKRARQLDYKDFDVFAEANDSSNMIAVVGNDNLITHYQYEMAGHTRDELLERDMDFDTLLGTQQALLVVNPQIKGLQRDMAKALAEHSKDPKVGFRAKPNDYVIIHHLSQDPKAQEMYRMLPYEFRTMMESYLGKGKPIVIPKKVYHTVFGFKNYSVAEMFDKASGERNFLEKLIVNIFTRVYGTKAKNKAHAYQMVWQYLMQNAKQSIVIRSIEVLKGNIIANWLMLTLKGLTPVEIAKYTVYAYREGKRYRDFTNRVQHIDYELMANSDDPNKVKELQAERKKLVYQIESSAMHPYMQEGLMSSIVEGEDISSESKTFRTNFQKKLDKAADKVPVKLRELGKIAFMHPDSSAFKFLAEVTQFSDMAAKFALAKKTEERALKAGKSKQQAFQEGIAMAQDAFINYDLPTSRGMQLVNDLGIWNFTKFGLRFQKVLATELHQNTGHTVAQHFLAENMLGTAGVLNPLGSVGALSTGWGLLPHLVTETLFGHLLF